MINYLHPSLFFLLGIIFTFIPFFNRKVVLLLFALISFLLSFFLNYEASIDLNFLTFQLQLFRVDFISKTFVIIFTLIIFLISLTIGTAVRIFTIYGVNKWVANIAKK